MQKGFQTKKTVVNPYQLNLYIPERHREAVQRAKELMKKEGESLSRKVVQYLIDYVRMHEPGNPQLRLDRVLEEGGPRGPVCAVCGMPARYQVNSPGGRLFRCRHHRPRAGEFKSPWTYGEI